MTSMNFDSTATCDIVDDVVYATNARFASLPSPAEGENDLDTFNETFSIAKASQVDLTSGSVSPFHMLLSFSVASLAMVKLAL